MNANAFARELLASESLTPALAHATLEQARQLHGARRVERAGLLRGRRLGLMCGNDLTEEALRFRRAANGLGAEVAHILPIVDGASLIRQVDATARLLGRLYDAVECQGMDAALVRRLADGSPIPVYPGLACEGHAAQTLADRLAVEAAAEEKRIRVIQAVLLRSLD